MCDIRNFRTIRIWDMDPVLTGREIKRQRKRLHLSQDALLEILASFGIVVSKNSLSSWENGKKRPNIDHLLALCSVFDCSLDELVAIRPRSRSEDEGDQPVLFNGRFLKAAIAAAFFYVHTCGWL